MKYNELLSSYITQSGMSLTQICDVLKTKGYSTHKGHISKLQNAKLPPASDDLNRAIAEVTHGDAEKLIVLSYLEKAPDGLKEYIRSMYYIKFISRDLDYLFKKAEKTTKIDEQELIDFASFCNEFGILIEVSDLIKNPIQNLKLVLESLGTNLLNLPITRDGIDPNHEILLDLEKLLLRNEGIVSNEHILNSITPVSIKAWLRSDDDLNDQEKEELAEDIEEYFNMRKQRILKEREKRQE